MFPVFSAETDVRRKLETLSLADCSAVNQTGSAPWVPSWYLLGTFPDCPAAGSIESCPPLSFCVFLSNQHIFTRFVKKSCPCHSRTLKLQQVLMQRSAAGKFHTVD